MKPECRDALERAYLYLDREVLSDSDRRHIEAHLDECAPCFERVGLERHITMVVARLSDRSRCPHELRARITSLLQDF